MSTSSLSYRRTQLLNSPSEFNSQLCNQKNHYVQFYEGQDFLVRSVGTFVEAGIRNGEGAIVVATAPHRQGVTKYLLDRGYDVEQLLFKKQLTLLDAAETLETILVNEFPDPVLFRQIIGELIESVATKYPVVRAYGEMVGLLWQEGKAKATMQLEELWNDLAKTHSFSLLCGYQMEAFRGTENLATFRSICETHSHILPSENYFAAKDPDAQLKIVAVLQQQASSLKMELESRILAEASLRQTQIELERELAQRKRIDEQLIASLAEQKKLFHEAEEAIRVREEFLSIASHELRTPMTSLKMQLQMLKEKVNVEKNLVPTAQKLSKALEISCRQMDRLSSLVEDMLDTERIQAGQLQLRVEPMDLVQLVKEVAEQFRHEVGSGSSCPMLLNLPESAPGSWDRNRLEQVLINLLSNANKYAAKTPVEIDVSLIHPSNPRVRLVVRDFGPGISADYRTKIFERFARATPSRKISGLGLGLYIVKQIVESHGGVIFLEDFEGPGAKFVVELPLQVNFVTDGASANESENAAKDYVANRDAKNK